MRLQASGYKRILCVRADNMGDIIMSGPAIRALKESFQCNITLLTSSMGAPVVPYMPEIDDVMVCTFPWIKTDDREDSLQETSLVERITAGRFDAAIIFSVYSQNVLPTALLLYMTGIPVRVAYCRENPYRLLTHWMPDKEPYSYILHQVERDLALIKLLNASIGDRQLRLSYPAESTTGMQTKLSTHTGIAASSRYIVLHPGVSEDKRQYPVEQWIIVAKHLYEVSGLPLIISGSPADMALANQIAAGAGTGCFSIAGVLQMDEWIALLDKASLVISVNTGTVHISAALQTPIVVLYALTNPQHTPWMAPAVVLPFSPQEELKSKNEVIRYVDELLFAEAVALPTAEKVVAAAADLLLQPDKYTNCSIAGVSSSPVVARCL